jgi:hypothetical protein
VPQGSILGPLLFVLYINDLVVLENYVFVLKYADDTTLTIKNKNVTILNDVTNQLLHEVNMYFIANKLQLNANKTAMIGFQLTKKCDKFSECSIKISDDEIEFDTSAKLLGVFVDQNLKWNHHIDSLCKRLSKTVFALRVLKNIVSFDVLKMVYYAHFQSALSYCIEIWGQCPDYLLNRVFVLQKRAIRIIAGVPYRTSCRETKLFKTLNILPLPALYIAQVLIFMKKHPAYFSNCQFNHRYNTRHKNRMQLPKHNTRAFEKGLLFAGQRLFNKLPRVLQNEKCPLLFKAAIKKYLLLKEVYNMSDFVHDVSDFVF